MNEIEPCPFCDSTDTQVDSWVVEQGRPAGSHHEYAVVCQARDCGAVGPKSTSESGAVIRWNTRRTESPGGEQ